MNIMMDFKIDFKKLATPSLLFLIPLAEIGCGAPQTPSPIAVDLPNGATLKHQNGPNVLKLTVNGSTCAPDSYLNKPCVSILICDPASPAECQTITDVLVDTGSYGLRIFKSVLTASTLSALTPISIGSHSLAECVSFGDGSKDWGQIYQAGIQLGGLFASNVPIQVIDSTYSNGNTYCRGSDSSPLAAGFNGILGIGLNIEDCSQACAIYRNNGQYYSCNGSNCTMTTASLNNQVTNPISKLSAPYNNGIVFELPSIPLGGAPSIEVGYLILGVDTDSTNASLGAKSYSLDSNENIQVQLQNQTYSGFLDSGSNSYSLAVSIPQCSDNSGWLCPDSTQTLSATLFGNTNGISSLLNLFIGNAESLFRTGNSVFLELGAYGNGQNNLGLPFYIGRNIYLIIENQNSPLLGDGPLWGF